MSELTLDPGISPDQFIAVGERNPDTAIKHRALTQLNVAMPCFDVLPSLFVDEVESREGSKDEEFGLSQSLERSFASVATVS